VRKPAGFSADAIADRVGALCGRLPKPTAFTNYREAL
jgi:hypothetical protein